ncbi:hypothetical protein RHOFW510R12_02585 [Rhodanobacter sp. FW510-R12]
MLLLRICHGSFQSAPLFGEHHLALFDGHHPQGTHGVGHSSREISTERIGLRTFVLPLLQLVIDRRTAALLDDGVDLVDGDFVRPLRTGNELGGGFTGTLTGIADTAHGKFPVARRVNFEG